MKTKLLLIPLALVFLSVLVSAASVGTFLIYDETDAENLQITYGDNLGITVTADSTLESSTTITVDLLDSSGDLVENLLDAYTTSDFYYNHLTFGPPVYGSPGNYTIVSTVTAASGQTAEATLYLEVLPVTSGNSPPIITSTAPSEVNENTLYQYQVTATDADGDALTYSLTQKPTWLTINSQTGLISGTAPEVDDYFQYVATVMVSDGMDFDLQTFTIDVGNVISPPTNNPPVANNQNVVAEQNTLQSITLTGSDSDGTIVSCQIISGPTLGFINSQTANGCGVTYFSAATGTDSFRFIVTDDDGAASNVATVSITVNPVINNPPVITSTPVTSVNESTVYSYQVTAIDADNDTLTYSLTQYPNWLSIDPVTGLISGTAPVVSADTNFDVTVRVSDGTASISQSYILTVKDVVSPPANHPPVINAIPNQTINEGQAYSYQVVATDADGGDTLTYSFTIRPTWLSINSQTGLISGTASSVTVDTTYDVNVVVSDGKDSVSQSYRLTVINVPSIGTGRSSGGGGVRVIPTSDFEEQKYFDQFAPITAAEEEIPTVSERSNILKILLIVFWLIVFLLLILLAVLLVRKYSG